MVVLRREKTSINSSLKQHISYFHWKFNYDVALCILEKYFFKAKFFQRDCMGVWI